MLRLLLVALVFVALTKTASAQTSHCYWVGSVWTCDETVPLQPRQSGVNWGLGVMPDVGTNAIEAYNRARERRATEERARLESERLTAERDFYQSQIQGTAAQQSQRIMSPQSAPASSYGQAWLAAANQRRHLFKDFDQVVFAPDVKVTDEMVMLMSSSPYAADIAYYLGTHKAESLAISQLPLLDAARAIDGIESRIKADVESGK